MKTISKALILKMMSASLWMGSAMASENSLEFIAASQNLSLGSFSQGTSTTKGVSLGASVGFFTSGGLEPLKSW